MICLACCGIQLTLWLGAFATIIYFVKKYMQGGKYTKNTNAEGKVVIITGANTGIGKETARELAKRGATVYLVCRNMEKAEEARLEICETVSNKEVYCRQCDLSSFESIRRFAEEFKKEQQRLDILICNAGVMNVRPRAETKDGFEMQFGTNHLGHFLLTNLLLDLLKKSAPSRIIVVSSMLHKYYKISKDDLNSERSYDAIGAYGQSKLANILFTRELSRRLEDTNVTVNALHPGAVETDLAARHSGPILNVLQKAFIKTFMWPFTKSIENGAQTSIYAALDPDLEHVSGKYFSDCNFKEVSKEARNEELAKWLWEQSEKMTKL